MAKTAFIGLGVMGFPMAGFLKKAGHEVVVYNRSPEKAQKWVETYGGASAATPEEAARGADFVFSCVGNDDDLRSVTIGPQGAFAAMKPGSVFVDHTTTSANVARELYKFSKERGFAFIDAPVSGGQAGAEKGILTIMAGGDEAPYASVEPVLKAYGQTVQLMGPTGSGQLTKMVNQICIASVLQGVAEALNFGRAAGLDMEKVVKAVSGGSGASWQLANRSATMLKDEFSFGFAVDWMRKDLGFCLAEAKRLGVTLPSIALIDQFYGDVQKMGGGRWDTSSLIKRLK